MFACVNLHSNLKLVIKKSYWCHHPTLASLEWASWKAALDALYHRPAVSSVYFWNLWRVPGRVFWDYFSELNPVEKMYRGLFFATEKVTLPFSVVIVHNVPWLVSPANHWKVLFYIAVLPVQPWQQLAEILWREGLRTCLRTRICSWLRIRILQFGRSRMLSWTLSSGTAHFFGLDKGYLNLPKVVVAQTQKRRGCLAFSAARGGNLWTFTLVQSVIFTFSFILNVFKYVTD